MKKLLTLFIIVLLAGCSQDKQEDFTSETASENDLETTSITEQEDEGDIFSFSSVTLEGEAIDDAIFSSYDLTLINMWGTYCGPCIDEMPDLQALYENSEDNVNVVGIVIDTLYDSEDEEIINQELAQEIVSQTGVQYQNIVQDEDIYLWLYRRIQVVPTTIFVDKDGKIIGGYVEGKHSEAQYQAEIDQRLAALS